MNAILYLEHPEVQFVKPMRGGEAEHRLIKGVSRGCGRSSNVLYPYERACSISTYKAKLCTDFHLHLFIASWEATTPRILETTKWPIHSLALMAHPRHHKIFDRGSFPTFPIAAVPTLIATPSLHAWHFLLVPF